MTKAGMALPFLATAFLAVSPLQAAALQGPPKPAPRAEILEYGIFVVAEDHGEIPGSRATTLSGIARTSPFRFISRTDQIPARPCLRFGIRFSLPPWAEASPTTITIRVAHPRMTRPDGVSGTVDIYPGTLSANPSGAGFQFGHDWEMTPGTWTFSLLSQDKVLAEQRFEVHADPDAGKVPVEGCAATVS